MKRLFLVHGCPFPTPLKALLCVIPAGVLAVGCGMPGPPQPPSLNLPVPVNDLVASRTENDVRLAWTMPKRTTDKIEIKHPIAVDICRRAAAGACSTIATIQAEPGKPAGYTDTLGGDLTSGPLRPLSYQIKLVNRLKKSAGSSNTAETIAGATPPVVAGLAAQVLQKGVLLSWHPATSPSSGQNLVTVFRIERTLTTPGITIKGDNATEPGKKEQVPVHVTLEVRVTGDTDPGHAMDANAQLNQRYRYTVARVERISMAGQVLELQGRASDPIVVVTTDVFPPAVPKNLAAVADAAPPAIDLSWFPDTAPDLAGYYVYRRDQASGLPAQRLGGPHPLIAAPSFHDTNVQRGHAYLYSVSAIDESGNESARSPEVEESVPNE